MKVVVETPKYSFFKYNKQGDKYQKVFFSPIPTIFNYGFIDQTIAKDGMQIDAIILGNTIKQGTIIEFSKYDAIVKFIDDSIEDDKYIFGNYSGYNSKILPLYFHLYVIFKKLMYLILKRKRSNCKFHGINKNIHTK